MRIFFTIVRSERKKIEVYNTESVRSEMCKKKKNVKSLTYRYSCNFFFYAYTSHSDCFASITYDNIFKNRFNSYKMFQK